MDKVRFLMSDTGAQITAACREALEQKGVDVTVVEKDGNKVLQKQVEGYIAEHGLAGMTLSTNKYAPAPKFYEKNGFGLCEHVIFMAKEME